MKKQLLRACLKALCCLVFSNYIFNEAVKACPNFKKISSKKPDTLEPGQKNYVINGSFEDTDGKSLDDWVIDGDKAAKASLKGHTGKYQLGHYSKDAFRVTTYQKLSNLPQGKYTLRGYIQTSGKLNNGYVFIKDYGGKDLNAAAPAEKTWWKYIEIKDIEIKNGQCTIGLFTDGNAGNWCGIDDLELVEQTT